MKKYIALTIYVILVLAVAKSTVIINIGAEVITSLPCIQGRIASGEQTPFILKLKELTEQKETIEDVPAPAVVDDELWRGRNEVICEEMITERINFGDI